MMRKNFWHLFKAKLWGDKFWTAGHFYRSVGVPRKYSPIEKLVEVVNICLEQCDEAIRRNCGFGKYTTL